MKTIFVQIASYRDPECQWTVKDLFVKAKFPERIRVGICWQYDPDIDKNCFTTTEREEQVRFNPFHWKESEGVCWARFQAQQLYENEDYVLSVDSHTRFAPEWDELLITQLEECPSEHAVLSSYPAAYTPPGNLQADAVPTVLRSHLYTPQGDLRVHGLKLDRAPEKPLHGAFCSGRFIFAKGELIREVPYDPYLYATQEDISLSVRLFTHGYDVYSLKNTVAYHYYMSNPGERHPFLHHEDNPGWLKFQERGRKRFNHLLGVTQSSHPAIIGDIEKFGLGKKRSLSEYETFTGIDFKNRTVSDLALRCGFIEGLSLYLDAPPYIKEVDDIKKVAASVPDQTIPEIKSFSHGTFDQPRAIERVLNSGPDSHKLNIDKEAPEGVLIIYDYIDRKTCRALTKYADAQAYTHLDVVDPSKSTKDIIVSKKDEGRITHHVHIDGKACEILDMFTDIYGRRMASFYDVNFEWYERPQILRYPPGGLYKGHADSENLNLMTNEWERAQDRDYSVLLYLNDDYEGGELELVNQKFKIKPKPGMLLAFPSDHHYLHAALPTTSGIRYVIVSWAAIVGTPRVLTSIPFGSVYIRQKRGD